MPGTENLDSFRNLKKRLCYQLSPLNDPEVSNIPVSCGFVEHHKHLCSLICRTVTLGESNSLLILGPRGSGKSSLLKSAIKEVTLNPQVSDNLLIVQLNGLLHTDDRIALKDFARQLKISCTAFGDNDGDDDDDDVSGSFAQIFSLILSALREERKQGCSIMVTLEEFDLFCSHKSQTLLYNLFDVSQSAQTPIIVIGLTTRFDVIELLEKRVKSRFSHRQIHLFQPERLDDHLINIRQLLSVPEPDHGWNRSVTDLLNDKKVLAVLKNWFHFTRDYHSLKKNLLFLVISLSENHRFLSVADIVQAFRLDTMDGKKYILDGLSVLELTLVICILNYTKRNQEDTFNFRVIYNEYLRVAVKKFSIPETPANAAEKAYQRLEQVDVIQSVEGRSSLQYEYVPMRLLVDEIQVHTCLDTFPNLPAALKNMASTTIHEAV